MKRNVKRHAVVQPLDQSIKIIPLTRGYECVVDAEDYERVNQFNWCAITSKKTRNIYAARTEYSATGTKTFVLMHRYIANCTEDVDHRDSNGLNNRKQNLRPCTDILNGGNQKISKNNKTGFKGVSLHTQSGKLSVNIYFRGKQIHLGLLPADQSEQAARLYDKAAVRYFGEFAQLNFPLKK